MSKKKTGGFKKFILALFILIMIGCALLVVDFFQKTKTPYSAYGESITVTIPKGAPVSSIARMLYEKKIISNYYYFRIYYRLYHNNTVFKNGEYVFDRPLTMKGVIEKLYEGKVKLYKITIREGLIIREIADVLDRHKQLEFDKDEFIRFASSPKLIQPLDPKADNLEGYLYPDTYMVRKEITTREMVELMVRKFKKHYTNNMKWRTEELKLSIRDIITLASLIEKETSSREERFLISSVFHNRLRIGMPMGCDPTIIYALKRDNVYKGKLGWAELKYDSPYNTRLYRGLPPGPICNPGYDSIEAALYPENTRYLYFVAKDSRSHYFSKNLKEHNRAVRKFIINKKK
jgi:UPF0755 protein